MFARIVILAGLLWAGVTAAQPSVYVFLPRAVKPAALEKLLQGAMPGIDVTVFGRINDLKTAVETKPPTAIIASTNLLLSLGVRPDLQGQQGGEITEAWVLVSSGPLEDLRGKTFGVVDILGRKKLVEFVEGLVGVTSPKVQSVSKIEDLLPLLQFGSADVVLVPESALAEVRSRSQMDLKVRRLETARVGRAAVAFVVPRDRTAVESALKGLPIELVAKLGVDTWKAVRTEGVP